jgi:hypothetical protein
MCASALAVPRLDDPAPTLQRLAPTLIPGIAVSIFAALAFGAHGLLFGVYMFDTVSNRTRHP